MSVPPVSASLPSVSGGINLNPSAADLFTPLIDWPMLFVWVMVALIYMWYWWQYKRQPERWPQLRWSAWRWLWFALAMLLWFMTTQSQSVQLVAQSMALYMARLMILAEFVPPLLILGLPRGIWVSPQTLWGRALSVFFDPWVAFAVWTSVIIFWNVPAGMNASVVSNTVNTLPMLYLLSSTMIWAVILQPVPSVQPVAVGSRGWFGLLAAFPMMVVASVWLYAREVLYMPYVNALCLWNLSPLQNQQYSGWIMLMAGMPAMSLAVVQLFLWLVQLSEGTDNVPEHNTSNATSNVSGHVSEHSISEQIQMPEQDSHTT